MNSLRFVVSVAIASALCASAGFAQTPTPSTPPAASKPNNAMSAHASDAVKIDSAQDKRMAATKDDGWSSPPPTNAQLMRTCMLRQGAKNPALSKSELTQACNEQLKIAKDLASAAKAPPSASPASDVGTTVPPR